MMKSKSEDNNMNVGTLIEHLQKFEPNEEVKLRTWGGEPVLFVVAAANTRYGVVLETESDVDMKSEIRDRFDEAVQNGISEDEVYSGMLELGIDVEMVRKYMGDDTANHMKEYCETHGLI